jgi:hypothetical protein
MPCIATQSGEVWLLIDDRPPHMISEACEETMMIRQYLVARNTLLSL